MFFDQRGSKLSQSLFCVWCDHQLIGIRASGLANSDSFAAPDQLGATLTKASPASNRGLTRIAIRCAIPAFHRLNGNAIHNLYVSEYYFAANRRLRTSGYVIVARNADAERTQVSAKVLSIL